MSKILSFLNPFKWLRASKYARDAADFDKSNFDLELYLYSQILKNNMLHYGYFEDPNTAPEDISFSTFEQAQNQYAQNIIDKIELTDRTILDAGCGMGGLATMLTKAGMEVECLTPNQNQLDYIQEQFPNIVTHQSKFEEWDGNKQYGTIIHSESLQYIPLEEAFDKVNKYLAPDGKWIIVDYFRLHAEGKNKSSHLLEDFLNKVNSDGWTIAYQQDITPNIIPTLKFIKMYVDRILMPLKHFGYEKLRFKKPKLYFMTDEIREGIDKKFIKEIASIDPEMFVAEKKYMLFVLNK